ncbi:MAG: hypothetical protein AAFR70_06895 [Pseudomonadota bacterium]
MASVLSDFAVLFGVFFVALVIYAWRAGWFAGSALSEATITASDDERNETRSDPGDASRDRAARAKANARVSLASGDPAKALASEALAQGPAPVRRDVPPPLPADENKSTGSQIRTQYNAGDGRTRPATEFVPGDAVHPAIRAAARQAAIKSAAQTFPEFWPVDRINARSGWMIFDVADFLGPSDTVFRYDIPGSGVGDDLLLYPIAEVRRAERDDTLIATSRRKVVLARWEKRQARRRAATRS